MDERSLRMYGVDCTVWRGSRRVWTIHKGNRKETRSDILTVMSSLCNQNLSINTDLHAANGKRVKALDIFAYALAFFKEQALKVTRFLFSYSCKVIFSPLIKLLLTNIGRCVEFKSKQNALISKSFKAYFIFSF